MPGSVSSDPSQGGNLRPNSFTITPTTARHAYHNVGRNVARLRRDFDKLIKYS